MFEIQENILLTKSKNFAIKTIMLYKYLSSKKREFILSKQLLKSGTSIGANIREAEVAMSRAEFVAKLNISLKEASETEYWLELLHETEYISDEQFRNIYKDCNELNKLLTAIIKSTKL